MTSNLDCSASALMAEITAHLRAVVLAQPLSVLDLALWEMNGSCANTMADSAVAVPMETLTAGDRLPSAADFESGGDRAASRVAELFHKYRLYELRILLHDHANEHGHMSYQDPITNDIVATSSSLEQREVIAEGIFKRALELCPKLQRLLQRGNSESLRSHGEGDGQQLIALLQAIDFLRCRHAVERHCPHGPSQTNFSPSMSATTSVEVTPRVASVDDVREILSGEYSSRHGAQPTIVPCSQAGVEADVPLPHLNNTDWWRLDQWSSRRHPVRKGRAAEESSLNSLNGLGSPAGRRADARGQQSPMEATFDAERVSCSSDSASGVELDEREDEDFVSEGSELEGEEGEESESPSTDGDDAEADADGVDDHSDRAWNVSSVRVQPTFQFRETPLRAGYSGHRFVLDELPEADVVRLKDLPHYLLTHQMNLEASSRQRQCYQDPVTGCAVLTSYFLQQFRSCFGEYCLHCPHGAACQRQLEESMLRMEESSSSSGSSAVSVSTEEMAEEQLGLPVAMPATPGGFVIAAKSLEDLLRWGLKPRASQPKLPLMELGDGASAATELPHPASPTNEEESLRSREQLERQAFSLRKFDFLDCSGL